MQHKMCLQSGFAIVRRKMETVILKYGQSEFTLPRNCITKDDLSVLFNLEINGAHLKIKENNIWINRYPDDDGVIDPGNGEFCYQ